MTTPTPIATNPATVVASSTTHPVYPPSFFATARADVRQVLETAYPGLALDPDTTWLVQRADVLPTTDSLPPFSTPLIDSLIQYFLGELILNEEDVMGLYPVSMPPPEMPAIGDLRFAQIVELYAEVSRQLVTRYQQKLADHWAGLQDDGLTRRAAFIAERIRTLKQTCELHIEAGNMSSNDHAMLGAMLRFGSDSKNEVVQPHGVFAVSLIDSGAAPTTLVGAFVLTDMNCTQRPQSDDESLGRVLFYTPSSGLEAYGSLKKLTEALTQKMQNTAQRATLQLNLKLADITPPVAEAGAAQASIQWRFTPLGSNFLDQLFTLQIGKQQSDFERAVESVKSLKLDRAAFETSLKTVLRLDHQFDNHNYLDRHDATLMHRQMPDWWRTMTPQQRASWLTHAKTFGESILGLQRLSMEYFKGPHFDGAAVFRTYIDEQLASALKRSGIELPATQILVKLSYGIRFPTAAFLSATTTLRTGAAQLSLAAFAHQRPDITNTKHAVKTKMTDAGLKPIPGAESDFISALTESIDDPDQLDQYLSRHLKSSSFGPKLRQNQHDMMRAQMHMGLLEVEQQNFPANGREWIDAVLKSPAPAARAQVNGAAIEVHSLLIANQTLPNVLVIAPTGAPDKGPLVLCTLNAPDNIVFRWFNSEFHLKTGFIESADFIPYLVQQLAPSQRPNAIPVLEYNAWLRHWRMPEIFLYLPQAQLIPSVVMRPVTFVRNDKDIFDDNIELNVGQLIKETKAQLAKLRITADSDNALDFIALIGLAFLPPPIMIPLALGLGLCKTWSGFHRVDDGDFKGAAQEFLNAIGYLGVAGVGQAGTMIDDLAPAVENPVQPHLVRRIGRDGQSQIGYLLSPARAPRFAPRSAVQTYDASRFTAIELAGKSCYVSRRFNLFGRSRVYRPHTVDANLLVHEDEYAARSVSGEWKMTSTLTPRLSQDAERTATRELAAIIKNWSDSAQAVDSAERSSFEANYMALAKGSNAEGFPEIVAYAEGESAKLNGLLRKGARNAQTRRFLEQFYQLKEWKGTAYRVTHVSSEGLQCIQTQVGGIFADGGLQSASVTRFNAVKWSEDSYVTQHATAVNHPVFFILAPSITKKNMFTSFLGDHVGVPPATLMQLRSYAEDNGQLFAYFDAPQYVVDHIYDVYSGEREVLI
jgi:hypothetical protein